MNNKKKEIFTDNVEVDVGGEEIVLASPTELINEAKEIAQSTKSDEKFSFYLQYDVNQKEFLMSMLQTVGAVIGEDDEENYMLSTKMNMTQLAFVKRLDCVERVRTNEGMNPFTKDHVTSELETDKSKISTNENSIESTYVVDAHIADAWSYEASAASAAASPRCIGCTPTNTSMETAQIISDESYTSGNICCPCTEQWFRFTANNSGQYTICTEGMHDTIGTLYDCHGNLITEVDDRTACGKLNFRIIRNLTANATYYVKVRIYGSTTGGYFLRITRKVLVDSVSVNHSTLRFEDIGKIYELPIVPKTFTGIPGAEPLTDLYATVSPSNADEKKVLWYSDNPSVLKIESGWYNNKRYQKATVVGDGIARLYAIDWNEDGKNGKCIINVPKVTVVSCIASGWVSSSNTMGENMATAFGCEGSYAIKCPTSAEGFVTCWNKANECLVIHTHGSPTSLSGHEENESRPTIVTKKDIKNFPINNRIGFIMMTACETAGGRTTDNVAYWLSKKINSNGIVIANTDTVSGGATSFEGENKGHTWKVYKNGVIQNIALPVSLTMSDAYNIYQLYK